MQVVDTTGAGDCFTGAYAVAVLEQQAPQAALRFAGAAVLQHPTGLFGSHARLLLLLLHSARVSVMCATGRSSTSCCMLESVYSLRQPGRSACKPPERCRACQIDSVWSACYSKHHECAHMFHGSSRPLQMSQCACM